MAAAAAAVQTLSLRGRDRARERRFEEVRWLVAERGEGEHRCLARGELYSAVASQLVC